MAIMLFFFIRAVYFQYWFSTFRFSKEVDPLDVLNVFVSVLIAVGLGYYITKKLTEQRFLKEFVIKDIYRIEERFESFEKLVSTNDAKIESIFAELHDLKQRIKRFEQTTKLTSLSCNEVENLNKCHTQLYKISTEKTILPVDSRNKLQQICDDFIVCLRKIVCTINDK